MLFMIDNYDSFTYNLVQYFGELGEECVVRRNDEISVQEIADLKPDRLVISPGPCDPDQAGITMDAIKFFSGQIPVLGVCLGHQAIGQVFGGKVIRASRLMHGKTSFLLHDNQTIYAGVPQETEIMRYHSLTVDRATLPDCLEVTSWTEEGELMGFRHKDHATEGVQFHPESIMTAEGKTMLAKWLNTHSTDVVGLV
ncbi:anthranilate synthase/aminodeoxychorismate synthase-like glutamine amidotransferase [Geomicrobium halophilum]|uniref:Anthranilate synthase/aminodeoxychorismate synthase-like glutamine amidotransferase n=1 Tax=Geomicrobium halophilum TaxID=549000 RepID=A0A841PV15_9BACL|nr:aminodeoxychorismate/anthranilate synthase component II [Geomicrobium halophilum]MBB6451564.1 anthranilate synthase/aminodeoxychorismate synthase-like glutamine amidotransferase [Geomicrobium halophilum]